MGAREREIKTLTQTGSILSNDVGKTKWDFHQFNGVPFHNKRLVYFSAQMAGLRFFILILAIKSISSEMHPLSLSLTNFMPVSHHECIKKEQMYTYFNFVPYFVHAVEKYVNSIQCKHSEHILAFIKCEQMLQEM